MSPQKIENIVIKLDSENCKPQTADDNPRYQRSSDKLKLDSQSLGFNERDTAFRSSVEPTSSY